MIWSKGRLAGSNKPMRIGRARVVIPPTIRTIYAIGDVHGCLDLLQALESKIIVDATERPGEKCIVMLGDYVDRGPSSAGVLEHLLAPPPPGFSRICLTGNHEQSMLNFLDNPDPGSGWMVYGGVETLLSYGIDAERYGVSAEQLWRAIPPAHLAFMRDLPVIATSEDFIFVHAGLRLGTSVDAQLDQDLIWIRDNYLSSYAEWGKTIVHGHTPVRTPFMAEKRIGIDTGAVFYGTLTGVRLEHGQQPVFLTASNS